MKKSVLFMAVAFGFTSAVAQDLTSKKGEQMLPEAGDWSIGVDATPFLEYAGNFFGKSAKNNAPTWNFMSGRNAIIGKYYTDAATAYRLGLRLGLGSVTEREMEIDRTFNPGTPNNYPNADPMVENEWKQSYTNIGLSVGLEKRKGKTRLQGYYGGEVGLYFANTKDKFTYGNALNASSTPSLVVDVDADDAFTGAGNIVTIPVSGPVTQGRVTERKNGSTFGFGIRGFIGCEFFILPKISLGGEFGWGIGLSTNGASSSEVESIGSTDPGTVADGIGNTTIEGAKGGAFALDTDNTNSLLGASGSLRLNFHF